MVEHLRDRGLLLGLELVEHQLSLEPRVEEGEVEHVVALDSNVLQGFDYLCLDEERVEAEALECLIEVLRVFQRGRLAIDHDLLPFRSRLFELNHAELSHLILHFLGQFESQALDFFVALLEELVEDDLIHGPAVVVAHLHQQSGAFHIFEPFGLRHVLQSPLLLLVELGQVRIGEGHVIDEELVLDDAVGVDALFKGSLQASRVFAGVLGVKADVNPSQLLNLLVLLPEH